MSTELNKLVVIIRGGGEIASAVAHKLARAHLKVCLTEIPQPQAVSRGVTFSEAIYDGKKEIEGVVARHITSIPDIAKAWQEGEIPVIIDPEVTIKKIINPDVLVDAIIAKRNLGTGINDAPLVIGLGPGFEARKDVHMVVETNIGDNLGKVILKGKAEKDTGAPIIIEGLTIERVLHAPKDGLFMSDKQVGDKVAAGEVVASVAGQPIKAEIGGIVRALMRPGVKVTKGTKVGEIDPTGSKNACYTIRPKMSKIAEGVLEAILMRYNIPGVKDD